MVVVQSELQALLNFGNSLLQFSSASEGHSQAIKGLREDVRGGKPLPQLHGLLRPPNRFLILTLTEIETSQLLVQERGFDAIGFLREEIKAVVKMGDGFFTIALSPPV